MAGEKLLYKHALRACKRLNILCYKFASPARRGVPDLILVNDCGDVMFIELKNPNKKGKLSALQVYEISRLRDHKARVHVIDSKEDFTDIVTDFSAKASAA